MAAAGPAAALHQPNRYIFQSVTTFFRFFQKTFLTARLGGTYKAAIDGVAAELSGEALTRLH
jgi:hypothetical protein